MSVFDGEIEYESVYMVDYKKHKKPKSPRRKAVDDDCLIVGFGRDTLKPRPDPQKKPDVLCPLDKEYYKMIVERLEKSQPKLKKMYFEEDIDPIPIEHEIQDLKRTEYLTKYCSRDELRRILRVRTGESTYGASVGRLGAQVLERNPYGPPREEPKYGRWRTPYPYTFRL